MTWMKKYCGLAIAISSYLAIGSTSMFAQGSDDLVKMAQDANQWVMPLGNYSGTRHSSLNQINTQNAWKLKVAWTMSTGALRGHEGQPLVVGKMMYFQSAFPNYVYAIDLDNYWRIVWKFMPQQDKLAPSVACCDLVNRGIAYANGKILMTSLDAKVYALDAKTGKVIWTAQNGDPKLGQTMTGAPLIIRDKVLVGISGGEYGVRGHVSAYNLDTGKLVWRAYSVGPDAEILVDPAKTTDGATQKPVGANSSLKTWENEEWKLGGGTTWGWYTYDPQLNLFYYGSGNRGTWNPTQRPGDNKWSMTIFARNPDTGVAAWAYQMTPHDGWDYDGINESVLTEAQIGGNTVPTLTHFDRNGFAYTLDRDNGELLVAEKYDPKVNWTSGVDMNKSSPTYGRPKVVTEYSTEKADVNHKGICPAALGTKDEQPAAYSPDTGLFYVPTNHVCMDYEPFRVSYTAGQPYVGATLSMYPPPGESNMGNFIAWDGKTGKIVWSNKELFSVWSGALATAGGVVFYGTLEGYLKAVDAKTGKELYKFKTPSGIIGNVTTYEQGGKQYVAVLSGVGGWAGIGLAAGLLSPESAAEWQGAAGRAAAGRALESAARNVDTAGLGAVGGYAALSNYTALGGTLTVFALPQ